MKRRTVLGLDLLATVVFVLIGLHAHGHGNAVGTFLTVWYPFAFGTAAASAVVWRTSRSGSSSLAAGAQIAIGAVGIGMVIRVITGQGTALAFIIVAVCFVTLFLTAWRFAVARVRRFSGGTR